MGREHSREVKSEPSHLVQMYRKLELSVRAVETEIRDMLKDPVVAHGGENQEH